jgi:hypothetical protein
MDLFEHTDYPNFANMRTEMDSTRNDMILATFILGLDVVHDVKCIKNWVVWMSKT